MTDEFFFITFGGLGVSLAGFAGLLHALNPNAGDDPITRWRIKNIVLGGFFVAFSGLLVWPVYRLTEDVETTVRIVSGFMAVVLVRLLIEETKPGPAWPSETRRKVYRVITIGQIALLVVSAVLGSVGFLELMFWLVVGAPVGTFVNFIQDLHMPKEPAQEG
jgi:nitrate reductase NapE component